MARILERGLVTAVGALLFMQEKAGEVVSDMIERGRLAPEEGRRFFEELSVRLEREHQELQRRFDDAVQAGLREGGLMTERDLNALRQRLTKLENRLADLEEKRGEEAKE